MRNIYVYSMFELSDSKRFLSYDKFLRVFFKSYLAAPHPTLDHFLGGNLAHLMLITAFLHNRPKGHQKPHDEFGSLSLARHPVGFEPGTFRF